jgi:cytochrome c biogenesis protein CcmG/thiol:disulfide interchange protein DsbE
MVPIIPEAPAAPEQRGGGMLASWKFWLVMGAIAAVAGLFAYGFTTNPKLVPSPLLGQPAPAFELQQLNGTGKVSLAELKGTPFILNFWASWCVACREEAQVLQRAHLIYELEQKKLRVIGIAVQDTPTQALSFARQFGKTYFLALDNPAGETGLNYGLYGVPETFFVDGQGIIRHKQIGPVTPELLHAQVERLTAPR